MSLTCIVCCPLGLYPWRCNTADEGPSLQSSRAWRETSSCVGEKNLINNLNTHKHMVTIIKLLERGLSLVRLLLLLLFFPLHASPSSLGDNHLRANLVEPLPQVGPLQLHPGLFAGARHRGARSRGLRPLQQRVLALCCTGTERDFIQPDSTEAMHAL